MKRVIAIILIGIFVLFFPLKKALAIVIVRPSQATLGQYIVFDLSASSATSSTDMIRLIIPSGVVKVVPNVKDGWTVIVKKNGNTISEIDWTEGSIPQGQRDDFYFQAQVPTSETMLKWKVYQTYQDGTTVAWINDPNTSAQHAYSNMPYSTTNIIDAVKIPNPDADSDAPVRINFAIIMSLISFMMSCALLIIVKRKL